MEVGCNQTGTALRLRSVAIVRQRLDQAAPWSFVGFGTAGADIDLLALVADNLVVEELRLEEEAAASFEQSDHQLQLAVDLDLQLGHLLVDIVSDSVEVVDPAGIGLAEAADIVVGQVVLAGIAADPAFAAAAAVDTADLGEHFAFLAVEDTAVVVQVVVAAVAFLLDSEASV